MGRLYMIICLALVLPAAFCKSVPSSRQGEDELVEIDEELVAREEGLNFTALFGRELTKRQEAIPFTYDLTQQDRIDLLNGHNAYRSAVDPPASNMKKLMWDNNLEIQAQVWASYCTFSHGGTWSTSGYTSGQNLYIKTGWRVSNVPAVSKPMKQWWDEVDNYDFDSDSCARGQVCGHYTQMARAKAEFIGCGRNHCQDGTYVDFLDYKNNGMSKYRWTYVCLYSAGNMANTRPYHEGECGDCDDIHYRQNKCENNLCVPDKVCRGRTCALGGTLNTETCLCENCPEDGPGAYCNGVPDADKVAHLTNGNRYGMHNADGTMPQVSELSQDLQDANLPWPESVAPNVPHWGWD